MPRFKKYSAQLKALQHKAFRDGGPSKKDEKVVAKTPKPPAHLRPETQKWWRAVVVEFDLDGHHLRLLQLAAEAYDQAQAAREVLDRHGQTFTDRFGQPKERPEAGILQNARIAFARLIRELALDGVDSPNAQRPPRTSDYGTRR